MQWPKTMFSLFLHDSVFGWAQLHGSSLHVLLARIIHVVAFTWPSGSTAGAGPPRRPHSHSWKLMLAVS